VVGFTHHELLPSQRCGQGPRQPSPSRGSQCVTVPSFFTRAWSDRTRGNGFNLKEGRFRLDKRKKFFTMKVVRPWPRLPREAVAASSPAVLKARLDGTWSTLGWWKMSLPMAVKLERGDL